MPKEDDPPEAVHLLGHGQYLIKLEKADARVTYGEAKEGSTDLCGACRFYDPICMGCSLVEGTIEPTGWCKLWSTQLDMPPAPLPLPSAYGDGERAPWAVFTDLGEFKEGDFTKPTWIPFLPKPGKYAHPRHGQIDITAERNAALIASFTSGVYQKHIPIDAEHETKLSGAVAWIKDMRQNSDKSADALVEWSARGQKLMAGGQFKYVSPEIFFSWKDPATEVVHENVIAGGAITTRPFFKDSVLRALVASESGGEVIAPEEGEQMPAPETPPVETPVETPPVAPVAPPVAPVVPVVAPVAEGATVSAKEFNEKIDELQTSFTEQLKAAETATAAEKKAREAVEGRLKASEDSAREVRFKEMISGKGADDGAPWAGDPEKHLKTITKLAETFGEDSEDFTEYLENQRGVAAQFAEADLFSSKGHGAPAASGTPEAKLNALATAGRAKDTTKTFAEAYAEALESPEGQKLYAEMNTPRR